MFLGFGRRTTSLHDSYEVERFRVEAPSFTSSTTNPSVPKGNKGGIDRRCSRKNKHLLCHTTLTASIFVLVISLPLAIGWYLLVEPDLGHTALSLLSFPQSIPSDSERSSVTNLANAGNGATSVLEMTFDGRGHGWFPEIFSNPQTLSSCISCTRSARPECAMQVKATADHCWSFVGFPGEIAIALSSPAFLTHIAVGHILAKSDLSSAPRDAILWGLVEGKENLRRLKESDNIIEKLLSQIPHETPLPHAASIAYPFVPIATFQYSIRSPDLYEVFDVFREVVDLQIDFGVVVLQINSNWGFAETHLYHLGIYGRTITGGLLNEARDGIRS